MVDLSDLYQWTGQQFKPPPAVPAVYIGVPPHAKCPIDMPSVSTPWGRATMDIYYVPSAPRPIDMPSPGMNYSAGQALTGSAPTGGIYLGYEEEY